jgi:O-antigen/teichoic acid export membrane protein
VLTITIFLDKPLPVKALLAFLSITMIINTCAGSFTSTITGYEKFRLYSFLAMATQAIGTILGIIALYLGFGLSGIGGTQLITAMASALIIFLLVYKMMGSFSLRGSIKEAFKVVREAAPLGAAAILTTIYYRSVFLLLSFIKGDEVVGYYNSAYALVMGLLVVPATFSSTLLPRMSDYFRNDPERLDNLYRTGFKYMFYFGISVAVGATILAGPIYQLVYPESYKPGAAVLQILIWALALMFVNALQGAHLVARNLKKQLMYFTLGGAVVNIALNLILIPSYSFTGAAVGSVASEIVTGVGSFIVLRKSLPLKVFINWILRLLPGIVLMIIVLAVTPGFNVIVRIILGATAIVGSLFLFGGLNKNDWRIVADFWQKGKR